MKYEAWKQLDVWTMALEGQISSSGKMEAESSLSSSERGE